MVMQLLKIHWIQLNNKWSKLWKNAAWLNLVKLQNTIAAEGLIKASVLLTRSVFCRSCIFTLVPFQMNKSFIGTELAMTSVIISWLPWFIFWNWSILVIAFNNFKVISLKVRKSKDGEELDYCGMLNRLLPPDIRVTGWCPIQPSISARFNCTKRLYKYFFPKANLDLNVIIIKLALTHKYYYF